MTTAVEVIASEKAAEVASRAGEQAVTLLVAARTVRIVDNVTAQDAADLRNTINNEEKHAEAARTALVKPLNDHVKWINEQFKPASLARQQALDILRRTLGAWDDVQRKEREDAERALREEQERERLRLEKLAEKAAARGDDTKAEEFAARAETVALAPTALPEPEAPTGIVYRYTYRAEVTDLPALLTAVLAGTVPAEAVAADLKYLNATARATKGAIRWPGVRFVAEKTVAAAR